jgi:adenine-specific DNA-methyltransferase
VILSSLADRIAGAYRPDLPGKTPAVEILSPGVGLSLEEVARLTRTARAAGHEELHLLAGEFSPALCGLLRREHASLAVPVRLVRIPRELGQPFGRKPPQFVEQGELSVEPMRHPDGGWDVRLIEFRPGLPISPRRLLPALRERNGFDFIDYWAVDFNHDPTAPFRHQWREARTRPHRRLRLQSEAHCPADAVGTLAVKVTDVFGYETLALLQLGR